MGDKIKPNAVLQRDIVGIERAEGENTYRLSFSSETPLLRWGEYEILDHADGAVDLTRLEQMGVVLFNHDRNQVVGRVTGVAIEDGRGIADIAFDDDAEGERIRHKVDAGTLRGVSVNYRIDAVEIVKAGAKSADGRFTGPAYIARKWTPLEVSIVSVPADVNVGVGRELEDIEKEDEPMSVIIPNQTDHVVAATEAARAAVPPVSQDPVTDPVATAVDPVLAERQRTTDITEACRTAGLDPAEYIRSGANMEAVLRKINEQLIAQKAPLAVTVERDEGDKFRAAAADALLMRGSVQVEKPADGATELRSLSLRDLAMETLTMEGANVSRRMSDDALLGELQRSFFSPTAAFPSILEQTIEKAYRQGYQLAQTTFDRWTTKGSLKDFKVSKPYYLAGSAGEFLHVPEGGELKHDIPGDHPRPGRQLQTYGRQFTMTREAFINDDIGFLTTIPSRYAASAKRTIAKQVYGILTGNPIIYDGEELFSAEHNNDYPGSAPTKEAITGMLNRMLLMKSDDGDPLALLPRYILAPVGLASEIMQIVGAASLAVEVSGIITTQSNPLAQRRFEVVEDPFLNTLADENGWYMAADPATISSIQVDYLNGVEIPSIRRMEVSGRLGFVWDIWLDWGVTAMDYRGIIRNKGQ